MTVFTYFPGLFSIISLEPHPLATKIKNVKKEITNKTKQPWKIPNTYTHTHTHGVFFLPDNKFPQWCIKLDQAKLQV